MGAEKGMGLREKSRRKSAGIVIPVDGPAGSGKSTAAKGSAERLGFDYLESGALYRAVGYRVLRRIGRVISRVLRSTLRMICASSAARRGASGGTSWMERTLRMRSVMKR